MGCHWFSTSLRGGFPPFQTSLVGLWSDFHDPEAYPPLKRVSKHAV